jgi:hypothetical protein
VRPLETLMDVSNRKGKAEVFLHSRLDSTIWKPVPNQGVGNNIAHLEGVPPSLRDARNRSLKVLAAIARGTVHADARPDHCGLPERNVRNNTLHLVNPLASSAAPGTGGKTSADSTEAQSEHPSCRYQEHSAWPESSFVWAVDLRPQPISEGFRPFFCTNLHEGIPLCMN